jgi:hypothetical protein
MEKPGVDCSISEPAAASERVFSIGPDHFFLITLWKITPKQRARDCLAGQSVS